MIKNNIKSIICLIVVSIILKDFFTHNIELFTIREIILYSLIFIITYFLFGFLFLENMGSFKSNFKSVLTLCIIGFIIWTLCFYKTDYKFLLEGPFEDDGFLSGWWIDHDFAWEYFYIFSMPLYFINLIFGTIVILINYNSYTPMILDILSLYNIFLPSLLLCLGIKLKIKVKKETCKVPFRNNKKL